MSTTGNHGAEDFSAGDRISLRFDDTPGEQITATVRRKLSDIEEGCSTEVEQYVGYWLEICCEGDESATICNVLLLTTGRYWLDGRFVTIRTHRQVSQSPTAGSVIRSKHKLVISWSPMSSPQLDDFGLPPYPH